MQDEAEQAGGVAWVFAFRGRDLLVVEQGEAVSLPGAAAWAALGLAAVAEHALGLVGPAHRAVELPAELEPPPGTAFHGLRGLYGRIEEAAFRAAGRAVQVVEWDRTHRFCGTCGTATERVEREMARRCPGCGAVHYPRVSPAVIVRVEHGDRILLGRGHTFPPGRYSVLAGFVEPGESLEETVAREIREEAGIEVANVRYFGSQPWPFPNSLMVAFTAEYAGGELRPQPEELEDVRWFTLDELPPVPPPMSIARALVDDWVQTRGGDARMLRTSP
jgi:NAD+ diphosphatase